MNKIFIQDLEHYRKMDKNYPYLELNCRERYIAFFPLVIMYCSYEDNNGRIRYNVDFVYLEDFSYFQVK